MNKTVKILGGLFLIVIAIFVALIILANVLITPERIKQTVLPMAEQALQRDVELGDINISLLSGIELHALKIHEPDTDDPFVAADLVRLKYQLLPLLALKVVIDEVRLERPQIKIARLKDGSYNFSDIIDAKKGSGDSAQDTDRAAGDSGVASPIKLLVSQVRVIDGDVLFLDHLLNDQAPYRFQIKDIQAVANGIKLSGAVPFEVAFNLHDSQVAIDGEVDLLRQNAHVELDLQKLNLLAFRPYFVEKVPGTLGGITVDLRTVVDASQSEIAARGRLDITDLDLTLEALPDAPIQDARVDVAHDLKFNLERGNLDLKQLDVNFNGLVASLSGTLNNLFEKPVLNATVQTPGIDLRTAMVAVPTELVSGVKDVDPAGNLKFEAQLGGSLDKPLTLLKSALITIENIQATVGGQRPSFDGRLRVDGDQAQSEELKVRLGDNTADLSLKLGNLYGKPLNAALDMKSDRFELDPVLRGGGAAAVAGNRSTQTTDSGLSTQNGLPEKATEKELGPFDIPLTASGSIRIGETLWKGLSIRDFVAHYNLKNNVLSLSRIDGNLAGGSFHNTALVDLAKKGLAYKATVDISGIKADSLVSALFPTASGTIFGSMDLDAAVNGRGTRWEVIRRDLNGSGEMMLSDGKMVSPQLVQGFSQILQIPDMNEIVFDTFRSGFNILNGKVHLDGRLDSRQVKLAPKGSVGLDGSLDIALDTRLSPEVSARIDQKNQVAQYLADNEGWSQLPLLLSGNLSSPRFGLDPKGLKAQATKALGKELERQVDKLFQKQQESQQSEEQQPDSQNAEDPTQKMLKEGLKKLFGN